MKLPDFPWPCLRHDKYNSMYFLVSPPPLHWLPSIAISVWLKIYVHCPVITEYIVQYIYQSQINGYVNEAWQRSSHLQITCNFSPTITKISQFFPNILAFPVFLRQRELYQKVFQLVQRTAVHCWCLIFINQMPLLSQKRHWHTQRKI